MIHFNLLLEQTDVTNRGTNPRLDYNYQCYSFYCAHIHVFCVKIHLKRFAYQIVKTLCLPKSS